LGDTNVLESDHLQHEDKNERIILKMNIWGAFKKWLGQTIRKFTYVTLYLGIRDLSMFKITH
jgi:hypothetical protein